MSIFTIFYIQMKSDPGLLYSLKINWIKDSSATAGSSYFICRAISQCPKMDDTMYSRKNVPTLARHRYSIPRRLSNRFIYWLKKIISWWFTCLDIVAVAAAAAHEINEQFPLTPFAAVTAAQLTDATLAAEEGTAGREGDRWLAVSHEHAHTKLRVFFIFINVYYFYGA